MTFEGLLASYPDLVQKVNNIERLLLSIPNNGIADLKPMNILEASEFLGLKVQTIYGLVSRNEIPHAKKNNRLYFAKSELQAYIESGRKKTAAEIELGAIDLSATKRKRRHQSC